MEDKEIEKKIDFIFGYDSEKKSGEFNRHPQYISITGITKKHTVGRDYFYIKKDIKELLSQALQEYGERVEKIVTQMKDVTTTEFGEESISKADLLLALKSLNEEMIKSLK